MLRRSIAIVVLASTLAIAQTTPTSAPTTAPSSLDKTLERIDAQAGAYRDFSATFVQEKVSPLMQKPIVTRGTLRARGNVMLWASEPPDATRMRIDPTTIRIFYPSQKRIEQYPVTAAFGAMASSPLPRLADLRRQFSIVSDRGSTLGDHLGSLPKVSIRLTPTDERLKQYISGVRVALDFFRGVVTATEVTDADGEVTTIRFDDIRTDTDFPAAELELNAPAGTTISRPLEPGAR